MTPHRVVLLLCLVATMLPAGSRAVDEAPAATLPSYSVELGRAARRGDAQAQYDLAVALDCGCGVRRDAAAALDWLLKAAAQGHVNAQAALGWKYMSGSGAPQDDALAVAWLRRAAEGGNTSAQNNLGIAYAEGRGVAADPAAAEQWFRRAAGRGAEDAQRNLDALLAGDRRGLQPAMQPPPRRL
jgi:hypothetical protein